MVAAVKQVATDKNRAKIRCIVSSGKGVVLHCCAIGYLLNSIFELHNFVHSGFDFLL